RMLGTLETTVGILAELAKAESRVPDVEIHVEGPLIESGLRGGPRGPPHRGMTVGRENTFASTQKHLEDRLGVLGMCELRRFHCGAKLFSADLGNSAADPLGVGVGDVFEGGI